MVEEHPETRTLRPKVVKVGLDPHFGFANMLCDVAWSRNHGTSTFIMPDLPVLQPALAAKPPHPPTMFHRR